MARGGARSRSGPPPDPQALRRERDKGSGQEWTVLPVEGRAGDPPEWPLDAITSREEVLWAGMWRRPQAVMWARNGQELEVALHVRTLVAAEGFLATAATRTLVLRQQEHLGLSIPGLHRNRWRIGDIPITAPPAPPAWKSSARKSPPAPARTVRGRLKVVDGTKP